MMDGIKEIRKVFINRHSIHFIVRNSSVLRILSPYTMEPVDVSLNPKMLRVVAQTYI